MCSLFFCHAAASKRATGKKRNSKPQYKQPLDRRKSRTAKLTDDQLIQREVLVEGLGFTALTKTVPGLGLRVHCLGLLALPKVFRLMQT